MKLEYVYIVSSVSLCYDIREPYACRSARLQAWIIYFGDLWTMSGLLPVLTAIRSTLIDQLKTRDPSKNLLTEFLSDMVTFSAVRLQDVMYSVVVAIVLTLLRMALSHCIYKVSMYCPRNGAGYGRG